MAGMCRLPFAGFGRLDKLEDEAFFDHENGNGITAMVRMTILDAVSSYLFFGLGKNGTVADEFLAASDYLFQVTDDSATWPDEAGRRMTLVDRDKSGPVVFRHLRLSDEEMKAMTFPSHFEVGGFSRVMTLSRFRRLLNEKRMQIIESNREQVKSYMRQLRADAAGRGEYLKGDVVAADFDQMLVEPTPEGLASLLYPRRAAAKMPVKMFILPRRERGKRAA